VEIKSIEALSDSAALYRAAKSTTTVAKGKLQHTSASRANGGGRANQFEAACDHARQMDFRKNDGDSKDWAPQERRFQAGVYAR
jgi:hypothetical protein